MPTLMQRLYGAYAGFREPALYADPTGAGQRSGFGGFGTDWGDFAARQLRYRLLWAFYEQNAYRDVMGWPAQFRATFGLYEGVRDVLGVAHQLGEFWTAHLQGGHLDQAMGDGQTAPSALPVVMDREDPAVREGLAELVKRSNWGTNKDVMVRFGVTVGDVFLEVCDDADAATVRLNVVGAGRVKWDDCSAEGNIEAYELEYRRPDPRQKPAAETRNAVRPSQVTYNEVVTPEPGGGGYRWRTYMDGVPYTWPGNPQDEGPGTWVVRDLPFAPLVKAQHINIGLGWGHAEAMAALTGMREIADLSSCLTDWARKACNAPHLLAGMEDPAYDPKSITRAAAQRPTAAQYRAGYGNEFAGGGGYGSANGFAGLDQSRTEHTARGKQNYLYHPSPDVKAQSLVHPLPVGDITNQIKLLKDKNEADYPEISFERIRTSGQASAEAIREARKPAEAKVHARRVEYDGATARAFKMALTLGGLRGYQHYEGFNAGSYDDGALDFRIGDRPAFAPDPAEKIAERQARYAALKAATDAGLPLELAMSEAGYSEADIASAVAAKAAAQAHALAVAQAAVKAPAVLPPQTREAGASA